MKTEELGMALTRGLKREPAGECPALEELALLADGTAHGDRCDALMGHLAQCGRCREIFVTSRELLSSTERVAAGKLRFLVPSAFAAAAVLVLALTLTLGESPTRQVQVAQHQAGQSETAQQAARGAETGASPLAAAGSAGGQGGASAAASTGQEMTASSANAAAKKEAPVATADGVARLLARTGDLKQMAALTGVRDKSLGFADASSDGALCFRIGSGALELELALLADDTERAQAQAARLGALIEALPGDDNATQLEALVEELDRGAKPSGFAGKSAALERSMPVDQVPLARLGAWTQGARFAARTGNAAFFAHGVPAPFRGKGVSEKVPREAARALEELDLKLKQPRQLDFNALETVLNQLVRAF